MALAIRAPRYAGQQEETLSLTLPEGRRPDRLPRDREITGEGFRYVSHYGLIDGTIVAHRGFVSTFSGPLCQGAVRASVAKAFDTISATSPRGLLWRQPSRLN